MRDEGNASGGMVCCEACGTAVPSYDVVNYGSIDQRYRELCSRCFNAEVTSALGLLFGSMTALDAFELTAGAPGGYQFQILGKPDDEPLSPLGRLMERMRRSLSVKYLVPSEHGTQIADFTACGRIEWDQSEDGRVPLLVIDGQNVSWDELGRTLMSFEGWQFRLVIGDRSEEV